jgi:hypothetical protein
MGKSISGCALVQRSAPDAVEKAVGRGCRPVLREERAISQVGEAEYGCPEVRK